MAQIESLKAKFDKTDKIVSKSSMSQVLAQCKEINKKKYIQ